MEHATLIDGQVADDQYIKHVGYSEYNICMQEFYSRRTIDLISKKVTELLIGVDRKNRPIIVPDKSIASIMNNVYDNYRPETGDIYSRYIIPKNTGYTDTQRMIDMVINIITSDVRNNLEMEENNEKLSIWSTVYGDFNAQGLQQHPKIKLRERRPTPMLFNMNY